MAVKSAYNQYSKLGSRAVMRLIEPGGYMYCAYCDKRIKFATRLRLQQVIANVYLEGSWDRVEHFHEDCYAAAGHPYGIAIGDHRTRVQAPDTLDMQLRSMQPPAKLATKAPKRKRQPKG
jgi:hypothetical protein